MEKRCWNTELISNSFSREDIDELLFSREDMEKRCWNTEIIIFKKPFWSALWRTKILRITLKSLHGGHVIMQLPK